MNAMNEVYITGTGAFLPGDPVDNEQLAARFGANTRRPVAKLDPRGEWHQDEALRRG